MLNRVTLDFQKAWCADHLLPFKKNWPAGSAMAMVMLFQAFAADERTIEMAGGDANRLDALVLECSPLCCFISPEALDKIYSETAQARLA